MNEQELYEREICISNFISVLPEYVKARSVSDCQCDIRIMRKDGTWFRYGYFQDWVFWRENPVWRALSDHGLPCYEGDVGFISEPQYDMVIYFFSMSGEIRSVSDKRTTLEIDYNYSKFEKVVWRLRELFGFRNQDDDKTVVAFDALCNVFEKVKQLADKK